MDYAVRACAGQRACPVCLGGYATAWVRVCLGERARPRVRAWVRATFVLSNVAVSVCAHINGAINLPPYRVGQKCLHTGRRQWS